MSDEGRRTDMERMGELLDLVTDKVPVLLNGLTDAIYGRAASAKFGSAVADFYGRLKESGMTEERAFALTEEYLSPLNLGGLIARAVNRHRAEGD